VGPREPDAGGDAVIASLWSILAFPSVTTVALVALWAAGALSRDPRRRAEEHAIVFPVIAIVGIALYLTTIGSPSFNLYRLGFSPYTPLVLAIIAALAAKQPRIAVIALLVLIAFDVHLYRSRNLFDYALDPILVATAAFWCVRWVSRSFRRVPRDQTPIADQS
jgi:membrane-associated HD superfamily phosphohydrolase